MPGDKSRRNRRCGAIELLEPRRLLAGASLDPTFAGGHAVIDTATPADLRGDYASDMLVQPDGKVVVAGTAGYLNGGAGLVVRLNPDGSRDTAFGTGSTVLFRFGAGTTVTAVRRLESGKLLLAGSTWAVGGFVARLNTDGSLDGSFGSGGVTQLAGTVGTVQDMIVLPDGRLLVSGVTGPNSISGSWTSLATVARLNADGRVDPGFGTNGRVTWDQNDSYQRIAQLLQLSPTNVLAVTPRGMVSINPLTGAIGAPVVNTGVQISEMLALPDGGVAAIGLYTQPGAGIGLPALMRLLPSGALDTSAFTGGVVTLLSTADAIYRGPTTFVREADGSFAVWLASHADTAPATLIRVLPDGQLDSTFNGTGGLSDPADRSMGGMSATHAALDPQGRLIATHGGFYGPRPDGTNVTDNVTVCRYLLDMGLTPVVSVPSGPLAQGQTFAVSAAGTLAGGSPVVKYEWDADLPPGITGFTVDATGIDATLTARRAGTQRFALRLTTADGASTVFVYSVLVTNVAPTIGPGAASGGFVQQPIGLNFTVSDPGLETFTVTVDPGDGTAVKTFTGWTPGRFVSATYASPGTYTAHVTVTDSGGLSATTVLPVTVTPVAGRVVRDSDGVGLAGATVFVDADRDGVFDSGEVSTTSGGDGVYQLPALPNGSYTLGVVGPAGYFFAGTTLSLTLPMSSTATVPTFRLSSTPAISGNLYADQDKNGVADTPLTPVAGATVWLDLDDDGVLDANEPKAVTPLSNTPLPPYSYTLPAPGPGTYRVRVLDAVAIDAAASAAPLVAVGQNERAIAHLTATRKAMTASLNVSAYLDANGNGTRDNGEAFIGGLPATVSYTAYPGSTPISFTTLANSSTTLSGLTANTATVALTLPPAYAPSTTNGSASQTVTLVAAQTTSVSFGLKYTQPFATITGRTFEDADGDDTYDAGERLLTPTVYADLNDNHTRDANEPAAVLSTSTQTYTLKLVPPGTVTVRVLEANGFANAHDDAGRTVVVGPNETRGGVDFSVVYTGPASYVADILGPTQIVEGQKGFFGGSGSSHNVSITGFEWDLDYTPGGPFTVDASGYTVQFGDALDGPHTYTIAGRSVDSEGRRSEIATWTFKVVNAPPTATFTGGAAVALGGVSTVQFTNATDPFAADNTGLTYSYDFNNDGDFADLGDVADSPSPTASSPLATVGVHTVRGRVTDKDGGWTDYTAALTVNPPAWLSATAGAAYSLSGGVLAVTAGVVTLLGNVSVGQPGVSLLVSGSARAVSNAGQVFANLTLQGGAAFALAAGGDKVLRARSLGIAAGATLDLNDNALIYDYDGPSPEAAVRQWITSGRAGGSWAGSGLRSTIAQATAGRTALGYLSAADYHALRGSTTAFYGVNVDDTAVLVRYTLAGDIDLDGGVSINDFNRFSASFGGVGKSWRDGDMDYDNGVSINDFNLLSQNFGLASPGAIVVPPAKKGVAPAKR